MNITELHEPVWRQLLKRREKLPHALLLAGRRGIGKFELARAFAAALLCERLSDTGQACGSCLACGWFAQGNHPDFRLLQPQSLATGEGGEGGESGEGEVAGKKKASQQITIEQIRALDDFLHVGTHRHGARIVLLNPAEAMNRATANALLKSLEEPIAGTLFLLVTNEPFRLLPTIRSRCQTVPVDTPAHAAAAQWLHQGGVADSDDWLALAGGAPLLALELAGSGERVLLDSLLAQVSRGADIDPLASAAHLEKAVKAEKRPAAMKRTLEWAQEWLYDLVMVSQNLPPRYFLPQTALLRRLARHTDLRKLLAFNGKAIQYKAECEQPLNSRLFLEEFFLSYAQIFRR